jgi:integrase
VHRNFADPETAAAYKERMLVLLSSGVLPVELTRAGVRNSPPVPQAVRRRVLTPVATSRIGSQAPTLEYLLGEYLNSSSAKIASSSRSTVETLRCEVQGRLDGVKTAWVDAWVSQMKRESRLAPGTIRKKVEALARAIDWWNRQTYQTGDAPANVLRLLPVGYSRYSEDDVPPGEDVRSDKKRDRRLNPGEYEEIESVLQGKHRAGRERPFVRDGDPSFLMLFRLIVHTGLRLREAYRLRRLEVNFPMRTIHVARSKTDAPRDVPMTRQVEAWLREYMQTRQVDIVFPYWAGGNGDDVLQAVTARLSTRFASLFRHCGCIGLTEHDLRHEAVCRWMLMRDAEGRWLFRPEEVRRITGHKNVQQFERYLSMRGSDLAQRLE